MRSAPAAPPKCSASDRRSMSSRVNLLATGTGRRPGLPPWILQPPAPIPSTCAPPRRGGGAAPGPPQGDLGAGGGHPVELLRRPPKGRQNLQRLAGIVADRLGHDIATPIAGVEPGRIHDRALAELAARVQ